jgi:OOP family OmpA-OmpF porin
MKVQAILRRARFAAVPALAACAVLALPAAHAQSTTSSTYTPSYATSASNWAPWGPGGYIGLNAGRSDYSLGGGDDKDNFGRLSLGAMVNPNFGYEIGYVDFGNVDRAGGNTKARGVNLSLVGRVPLGERFGVFGKLGTTYGRSTVSSAVGSGVTPGRETGWGVAYSLGASFDITQQWSVVAEWERHDIRFAGTGREEIDAASIGVRYRF